MARKDQIAPGPEGPAVARSFFIWAVRPDCEVVVPETQIPNSIHPATVDEPVLLLYVEEVVRITGLARSTLFFFVKLGKFPAPVKPGGPGTRRIAWLADEVRGWLAKRVRERDSHKPNKRKSPKD